MHPMVIAVYRKKNPNRPGGNVMVWHRDVGFLVSAESLIHGHILWALTEGREDKARIEMRFCETVGEIVFREKFVQKKREYKSWESIKAAIRLFFNGSKPVDMSWNEAKLEMEKKMAEREGRGSEGYGLVRWPSLMEHRAGTKVLQSA
jgi:hypothetical protein